LYTALAMTGPPAGAAGTPDPAAIVANDGNAFAVDLYGRLRSAQIGNLFFSLQSISTALAMTYAGARGATATEMARTLHFSLPQEQLPAAYARLLAPLNGPAAERHYQLSIANRLWGRRGTAFLEPFLTVTRKDYGAELGLADFAKDAEAARAEINAWVRKQTADKINDLIPPGVLGPDTRLVLANAIYFRGTWARQFSKSATQDQPFHVSPDRTVVVPLMFGKLRVGFAAPADGALKVVDLPYEGDDLSMLVLLPDSADGLAALEARLAGETLHGWAGAPCP